MQGLGNIENIHVVGEKMGENFGQIIYDDNCAIVLFVTYFRRRKNYVCSTAIEVPEIIDPVFVKTSTKRSFSMIEYKRFGLVFTNTRVNKFGQRFLIINVNLHFS